MIGRKRSSMSDDDLRSLGKRYGKILNVIAEIAMWHMMDMVEKVWGTMIWSLQMLFHFLWAGNTLCEGALIDMFLWMLTYFCESYWLASPGKCVSKNVQGKHEMWHNLKNVWKLCIEQVQVMPLSLTEWHLLVFLSDKALNYSYMNTSPLEIKGILFSPWHELESCFKVTR